MTYHFKTTIMTRLSFKLKKPNEFYSDFSGILIRADREGIIIIDEDKMELCYLELGYVIAYYNVVVNETTSARDLEAIYNDLDNSVGDLQEEMPGFYLTERFQNCLFNLRKVINHLKK